MSRPAQLLASGVVATALTAGLTAGGLAASTAPAQAAAPVSVMYSCASPLPGLPAFDVPASFAIPGLPAELPIGVPTPELPVTGTLQLNDVVTTLFALLGGTLQAVTSNVLVPLGAGSLGVQLQSAVTTVGAGATSLVTTLNGVLPSFVPDQTGTQSIALPTTIDLTLVRGLLGSLGVKCALKGTGTGGTTPFATYTVVKNASATSAKVAKVKQGKKPKVTVAVAVTTPGTTTLGSVTATEGGQSLGSQPLYGGVATFVFKKLSKGAHTVRFAFSGSNFANGSEQSVTFTFPKAGKKPKGKQAEHSQHSQHGTKHHPKH